MITYDSSDEKLNNTWFFFYEWNTSKHKVLFNLTYKYEFNQTTKKMMEIILAVNL